MRTPGFLSELFIKHQPELLRLLIGKFRSVPAEAEDIVQDVFHNILKIDDIESIDNPRAYLFQAANNLALNRIRSNKQHKSFVDKQDAEELNEISPERCVSAERDLEILKDALTFLPEKYRRTFILSRVEQKTYREISIELAIAESTVEKHIIKVLKYLRKQLEKEK